MSMANEYPAWIDEAERAIFNGLSHMDLKTLEPIDFFHFFPLYGDLWVDKVYAAITKYEAMPEPKKKPIELLPNPSSIRIILFFFLHNFRNLKNKEPEKFKTIADFLVTALKERCPEDTFAFSTNRCHSEAELESLLQRVDFQPTTPETVRELGRMYLGASSLINALMNDVCTDNGIDVFGPYDMSKKFSDNSFLLIKEFSRLRSTALWPEIKELPFEKITQYTVYKDVTAVIELVGCHFIIDGKPAQEAMTHYFVEVDGKPMNSLPELKEINKPLFNWAAKIYQKVKGMSLDERKVLAQKQEGHQLKDFFDYVGIDWQPSEEMKQRVVDKPVLENLFASEFNEKTFAEDFGYNFIKSLY